LGCDFDLLVKTPLDMENVAAAHIEELEEGVVAIAKPHGFKGIVLVKGSKDKRVLAEKVKANVPEAERIILAEKCVSSKLEDIVQAALEVAKNNLSPGDTFAVRTVRRGAQPYTSVDVNVKAGAAIKEALNNPVDLEYPNKVIAIEIVKDIALVGVIKEEELWRKEKPGKYPVLPYLNKIAVVQMPYLGPLDAAKTMGVRIGREVQTFEVKELIIAFISKVDAEQLNAFLSGVFEGIRSRYEIQKRSYARKPQKAEVYVQDLYQLVRERRGEPIIVLEPEGDPITSVSDRIADIFFSKHERVNVLIGSREGIPTGVYRFANLVVDICPGVTISTDYAAAAALIAISTVLEEKLQEKAVKEVVFE